MQGYIFVTVQRKINIHFVEFLNPNKSNLEKFVMLRLNMKGGKSPYVLPSLISDLLV